MTNWKHRYLDLARHISTWSKDPSTKIGAVCIGDNGQILSQGYNGFPRGIEDSNDRLNDREVKYDLIEHAELNCIYNACLNGISLKGSSLYLFGLPICSRCANAVIQVGITKVTLAYPTQLPDRWKGVWEKSQAKFDEVEIDYVVFEYTGEREYWLDTARLAEVCQYERNGTGRNIYRCFRGSESVVICSQERKYLSKIK